jgi:putative ABC transport system substrate-binding protein
MALGFKEIEVAAPTLGVTIQSLRAEGPQDFAAAFAAMRRERPGGLVVLFGPITDRDLPRLVEFTLTHRLPAVFEGIVQQAVDAGGLMSYGTNAADLARRAGVYIDKILRGARPADLPVEEPTKFELVINVKTAKALGLTLPPSLLVRADRVVE